MQELEAALVQLTGRTLGHLNDEGGVGVGDLEGAMEELTGVDGAGVDPLHLHEDADALHVSGTVACAAAHGVDDGVVLVLLGKVQSALGHMSAGLADHSGDHAGTLLELIVVAVALGLIQQLHGDLQGAHGLFTGVVDVTGEVIRAGVEGVMDDVIAELDDLRLFQPSQDDDSSAHLLAQLCSGNGFGGVALVAGKADDGVLAEIAGRAVDELVAAHPAGLQRQALALHKGLCRVQSTQRAAAAHEIDVLDAALVLLVLQNFSDDGLDVSVLVMHCITLLHFILNCLDSFRRFPEELFLP